MSGTIIHIVVVRILDDLSGWPSSFLGRLLQRFGVSHFDGEILSEKIEGESRRTKVLKSQ